MAKRLGIDIGERRLHIAAHGRRGLARALSLDLPGDLVRNKRVLSREAMADFLKEERKRNKLKTRSVALVLPSQLCWCRRVTMPYMSEDKLRFNLPYEFRDYISSGKDDYYYDHALLRTLNGEDGKPYELDLMAAAVSRSLIREYEEMFRRAGFKLEAAVPEEMAYVNLLRASNKKSHGHCLLDLGYAGIRLYIFNGYLYDSARTLDFGCANLLRAVADHFDIDIRLAGHYLTENRDGAAEIPECAALYNEIAVEVMKAINYYRFNNRGQEELAHIHCCGGGSNNKALLEALGSALPLPVTDMSEFCPASDVAGLSGAAAAAGASMQ